MVPLWEQNPLASALFTDLYELTMAQAFDAERLDQLAVFELAYRTLPEQRNFLLAVGLDDVLTALERFAFSGEDLAYLASLGLFSGTFLDRLARTRFTGDVYAVPEGTVVFPNEPIVQIVAPLIEGQIIETLLLNQVHFQSIVATKAARIVAAAAGRTVVDFGSRRAHGGDAALKVARVSYLAGAAGTSLVLAGRVYGIPIFGTMAHSYIQAHANEAEAFFEFARLYPETTLLVDTYDTLAGVSHVIELSRRLGDQFRVRAIRLDSGDLGALACQARQMLDAAGLARVQIFASSELDEHQIASLVSGGAPIDGFGVGTRLAVADDAPHVDMAYKLVEYAGRGRTKMSSRKVLYPGRKQVFRQLHGERLAGDMLGRFDEKLPGEPLLVPVMRGGKRLEAGCVVLEQARKQARRELTVRLPESLRQLEPASEPYCVKISAALERDYAEIARTARRQ